MTVHRKETVMALTRRSFIEVVGIGGAGLLATSRGAWASLLEGAAPAAAAPRPLLLHNNENPLGPGDSVLQAVRIALSTGGPAGRYPWDDVKQLHRAIAEKFGVAPENVITGCGSTQVLRVGVQLFTSTVKPLVAGQLTYEECASYASLIGTPVRAIPLDKSLQLDLDAMAEAAKGAGMVFLNNPNNPTGALLPAAAVDRFIEKVLAASPDVVVMIDEAYHDYVTDPSHRTQVARAVKDPRVIVARTFSKAHGMAGMRMGYAIGHPDTIKKLDWEGPNALNVAAIAPPPRPSRTRPARPRAGAQHGGRRFTIDWFAKAGYPSVVSRPTSSSWRSSGRRRSSARHAGRGVWWRATSRRSRRVTAASRSARSTNEAGGRRLREGARGQGQGRLTRG
jgi:histidinol-phosphate aminotransferase